MDALCMTSEEFDEYLKQADTLEIGEDHPQYTSGEPSYGMAIMKCSGKIQGRCEELETERDNILDRYNHSVSENTNLRSRCEALEKHVSGLSLLRDHLEEELGKMRNERDKLKADVEYLKVDLKGWKADSRLWYACFMDMLTPSAKMETERNEVLARCEKLNATCIELAEDWAKAEAERDEARQWARKLLAGMIAMREDAVQKQRCINKRFVELADLRAPLADARNKALDEAVARCRRRALQHAKEHNHFHAEGASWCEDDIRALKS